MAIDRDEDEPGMACAVCGAGIPADTSRCFEFGDDNALCWDCAIARGGRYDESRAAWQRDPDVRGLDDEAYGEGPPERRIRR